MAKTFDTFTTLKGTKLPLISLKGKPYMQVAHRLIWFEEENTNYDIQTTELTPLVMPNGESSEFVTVKTTVIVFATDDQGRTSVKRKATATKREDRKHFADFHEKAETGSLGRALAMLGYGTQFAEEDLNEGDRIVDSPVDRSKKTKTSSFRKPAAPAAAVEESSDEGF